ncbi:hypothetical protein [Nocardia brasiliensis]|uniref:hypothetical protein n=1 Tax=Nocardia brasiliensis TaxID=37326 RepID=UPI0033D1ABE7
MAAINFSAPASLVRPVCATLCKATAEMNVAALNERTTRAASPNAVAMVLALTMNRLAAFVPTVNAVPMPLSPMVSPARIRAATEAPVCS